MSDDAVRGGDTPALVEFLADRSAIVSSPAGAGKTSLLIDLVLAHAGRGAPLSSIVAITFTNKAAGEMKERLVKKLQESAAIRPTLARYFRGDERLRFSTIHSFLNSLLGSLRPELALMDAEANPAELALLRRAAIAKATRAHEDLADELYRYLSHADVVRVLEELFEKSPLSLEWADAVRGLGDEGRAARYGGPRAARFYWLVATLFAEAAREYDELKVLRGVSEPADIEYHALRFAESGEVEGGPDWRDLLAFFNENFDVLLVDEFQDTSRLQWRVIDFLAGDWLAGAGIGEAKTSRLYLIGDPKQSIYAFRNADVSVMQELLERFAGLQEDAPERYARASLTTNWRSAPAIVDFVNDVFSRLMNPPDDAPLWVTRYERFEAGRAGARGTAKVAVLEWQDGEKANAKERGRAEARYVARAIRELVDGGATVVDAEGRERHLGFSDVAIVIPTRTRLLELERALSAAGIPYVTSGGDYSSNQLFTALKTLFVAFGRPFDRGPFARAAGLFGVVLPPDVASLPDLARSRAVEAGVDDLVAAYRAYVARFATGPFAAFVAAERALRPERFAIVSEPEMAQARSLVRELFAAAEARGVCSPLEMAAYLEELPEEDIPEIAVSGEAVRVLTIHKAKGLEFPVVFVCFLDNVRRSNRKRTVLLPDEAMMCDIAVKVVSSSEGAKGEDDPARVEAHAYYQALAERAKEFDEQEWLRLMYVALTRARDHLVVVLSEEKAAAGGSAKRKPHREAGARERFREAVVEACASVERMAADAVAAPPGSLAGSRDAHGVPVALPASLPVSTGRRLGRLERLEQVSTEADLLAKDSEPLLVGSIAHELLSEFVEGRVDATGVEARAHELARAYGARAELGSEAAACVRAALAAPGLAERLRAGESEVALVALEGSAFRVLRLDYLASLGENVDIVDFKTDREPVEGERREQYERQLAAYAEAVSALYPDARVTARLLYVRTGRLEDVLTVGGGGRQ